MEFIHVEQYLQVAQEQRQIIDVRAPVEYALDFFPHSINLPIMNNLEREQVGTCYKQSGREAAMQLGHELVRGQNKADKILAWLQAAKVENSVLTCFRGGLRSQISQAWLGEAGVKLPRLQTGSKGYKAFLREQAEDLSAQGKWQVLSGLTGSGKSLLLRQLKNSLDLEALARHRGSAFGAFACAQPAQTVFENALAYKLIQLQKKFSDLSVVVEDESRMIGSVVLPEKLFVSLRSKPVVLLVDEIDSRAHRIVEEYVVQAADPLPELHARYHKALMAISKKLGGVLTEEIDRQMTRAFSQSSDFDSHVVWVKQLLLQYYDPLYERSLQKRSPQIAFRGNFQEVLEFLSQGV